MAWIQQNYLRTDTITTASARLVDAHAALPLTRALGSTEMASADGLRFVVPVRSVDGRTIGDGRRGPVVERLQELYLELVEADVASRAAP